MNRIGLLATSSIDRKMLMAATGSALLGFLVVHLLGNLRLYAGQESLNAYAAWLQGMPIVWPVRAGLAAVFAVHVYFGVQLARENRAARPQGYAHRPAADASAMVSRYMWLTGAVVGAFALYHLLHLTIGVIAPELHGLTDDSGRHDVYNMVVGGFLRPWISATYIAAMVLLGFHLLHGARSLLQTLGVGWRGRDRMVSASVYGLVALIALGNASFPVAVLVGVIEPTRSLP